MKKLFFYFLFFLVVMGAYAQQPPEPLLTGKKVKQGNRYAKTITAGDLRKHLYVLAADSLQGRETATKGQQKAAAYIRDHFKNIGLQPPVNTLAAKSFFQPFQLEKRTMEEAYIILNGKKYHHNKDFFYFGGETAETPLEMPFVGEGAASDYKNKEVKDKAVLRLISPMGATSDSIAIAHGINLTVNFSTDSSLFNMILGTYDFSKPQIGLPTGNSKNQIRQILISSDMAAQMLQVNKREVSTIQDKNAAATLSLLKNKRTSFTLKAKQKVDAISSENVLGYLEGTDKKEEVIVISAHYDHIGIGKAIQSDSIFNGADDDGSGTSAVMEIAQAFAQAKQKGKGPRRSILFMTVSAEEIGLLGSSYYVDHPVFPLGKTVTNLNIDMIGRIDTTYQGKSDYLYVVGADRLSTELHRVNEGVNAQHLKLKFDYKYNAKDDPEHLYERSDHYNFAIKGVPIIFYTSGLHADYHKVSDSADKIDYQALERRSQAIFYTAWELANRENKVELDTSLVSEKKP